MHPHSLQWWKVDQFGFHLSFLKSCISGCRSPNEMGVKSTVFRNNHSLMVSSYTCSKLMVWIILWFIYFMNVSFFNSPVHHRGRGRPIQIPLAKRSTSVGKTRVPDLGALLTKQPETERRAGLRVHKWLPWGGVLERLRVWQLHPVCLSVRSLETWEYCWEMRGCQKGQSVWGMASVRLGNRNTELNPR